ncbi:WD40/YVTN/BNR-like repeat-containing protein [Gemmatimonas sp.]|uniref:WD40/YVTN/BNR-like repeat-containing protein n=1 Tax=Gemmatimonas sp. TaxID=1962908 RepID=UPI003564BC1D
MHNTPTRAVIGSLALGLLAASSPARSVAQAASKRAVGSTAPLTMRTAAGPGRRDSSPEAQALRALRWRSLGPTNQAGRISVVAGVPGDPLTYYVGGANGGVIRTTNGGVTFMPIFEGQSSISIGAIAVAPSDRNIVYVGTGEGNPRNNASVGDGMYRSVDGGDHWTHIGLTRSDKIARLIVDAKDPDLVYACVLGREWGPSEERGVFKTMDGGGSWKKVLYVDPQTACSDISADPNNSNILYAGMYTYRRWAWHLESGGGNTAVWKSVNGGESWERLSGKDRELGLPTTDMDRIGIAVSPSDPDIVYVLTETKSEGELWRSDDGGKRWRMINRDPNINFRPFYYADIRVDPRNPNRVFTLSGALYFSDDGGRTFTTIGRDVHGDHQAMWIDPVDPRRILSGSDGGWQVSYDGGKNFEVVNTFPFTQFYHIHYDNQQPYWVCGGLQDNGTWCGPSNSLSPQGVMRRDWYTVSGGDGFFGVPDLERPWIIYSDAQGGMIYVTDRRSGSQKMIYPYPNRVGSVGDAMESHTYRFNWNSPIELSPQDPATVYFGGNVLFRSRDRGQSWEVISPDLTTNDKRKQVSSGGPIVVDNTAAEFHSSLLSIAPSPVDPNVIWVSTDDGNVQVTRDGGKTWRNVFTNPPGLKPFAWLPSMEASRGDAGTAYVVADHHQDDDYAPYAYVTTDYGATWTSIRGDLPDNAGWAHVIREDPKNRNLLYIGTEMGAWASWDKGKHWVSILNHLPVVQVRDIKIHPRENDLILATHGRGVFILDDLTPLQQLGATMPSAAALFDIRPATAWVTWSKDGDLGQKRWSGENPPAGAIISYWLKAQPEGPVDLVVSDKDGKVVRRLTRVPDEAGVNRAAWDLRGEGMAGSSGGRGTPGAAAADTSLAALRARRRLEATERGGPSEEERFFGPATPFVLPGTYTVTLVANGQRVSKTVEVRADPRSEMTTAQLGAQAEAAQRLQTIGTGVNKTIASVDDLTRQLTALQEQLRRAPRAPGDSSGTANRAVLTEIDGTLSDLRQFRDSVLARPIPGLGYRQYPRLREEVTSVAQMIARPFGPPTQGEAQRSGELRSEADGAQTRLDGMILNRIGRINQMLVGTPHVITVPRPSIVP